MRKLFSRRLRCAAAALAARASRRTTRAASAGGCTRRPMASRSISRQAKKAAAAAGRESQEEQLGACASRSSARPAISSISRRTTTANTPRSPSRSTRRAPPRRYRRPTVVFEDRVATARSAYLPDARRRHRIARRHSARGRRQDRRRDGLQRRHRLAGRHDLPGRRRRAEIDRASRSSGNLPGQTPADFFQPPISLASHLIVVEVTSPSVSSTAAQTNAELKLATWKRQYGIANTPATSGTEARSGPEKRPMKIAERAPFADERLARRNDGRMLRQRPHVIDAIFELQADPVRQPVAERGADRAGDPDRPEIEIAGADDRADADQRRPGRDQQRNEGERLGKAQHEHDRRRPDLMQRT